MNDLGLPELIILSVISLIVLVPKLVRVLKLARWSQSSCRAIEPPNDKRQPDADADLTHTGQSQSATATSYL